MEIVENQRRMAGDRLPCPRCRSILLVREGGSYRLLVCRSCGGLFARGVKPEGVSSSFEDGGSVKEATAAASEAFLLRDETAAAVTCPDCPSRLARYRVEDTDVELDACASHGVWFDRDELPKLARIGPERKHLKVTAAAASAAVAGGVALSGGAAAASPSASSGVGSAIVDVAGEVAVELVFDSLGDLISGLFS